MYIRHILESGNGSADRWLTDTSLKPIVGCKFGLELEVEGSQIPRANSLVPYWQTVTDGSLRALPEALEYKTVPLSLDGIKKALGVFAKASSKSTFKPSIRTSTHLHINVQDMTVTQVANFVAIYLLLEGSLYEICGKHRRGNVFCIPLTQCDDILRRFGSLCKNQTYSQLRQLAGDGDKYAALSLRSMAMYGTLEVRTHEGVSEKELDRVYDWAAIFQGIRDYAVGENLDPITILQTASNLGPVDFTKLFLGENFNLVDTQSFWDGISSIQYFANHSSWKPESPLGLDETPDIENKKPSKKKQSAGEETPQLEATGNFGPPDPDLMQSASTSNMSPNVPYSSRFMLNRTIRRNYNRDYNEVVLGLFNFNDPNQLSRLKVRASNFYGFFTRDCRLGHVRDYLNSTGTNIGQTLTDYDLVYLLSLGMDEMVVGDGIDLMSYIGVRILTNTLNSNVNTNTVNFNTANTAGIAPHVWPTTRMYSVDTNGNTIPESPRIVAQEVMPESINRFIEDLDNHDDGED